MQFTIHHFGLTKDDLVRKDNIPYLTVSKIAILLGLERRQILTAMHRHKSDFTAVVTGEIDTSSGTKYGYFFSEKQLFILTRFLPGCQPAQVFYRAYLEHLTKERKCTFKNALLELYSRIKTIKLTDIFNSFTGGGNDNQN